MSADVLEHILIGDSLKFKKFKKKCRLASCQGTVSEKEESKKWTKSLIVEIPGKRKSWMQT